MVDKKINESGETSFGTQNSYNPVGTMGSWFAKFFANKAKPYIAMQGGETPIPKDALAGDTFKSMDVNKVTVTGSEDPLAPTFVRSFIQMPKEQTRKERYKILESMDDYPEISSAFDIYADDSTQKDIKGRRWIIDSSSPIIKKEIEELFKTIKLEENYWTIIRNTCKFGDCFTEIVVDENNPMLGIRRLKVLNPNYVYRVENEYGYLTAFLQEIPKTTDSNSFTVVSANKTNYISLDKNQIVHFRLNTSDPKFDPYGKSIAASVTQTFKSLKMMEDAMLLYRLSRAPEKRVFYVNVGNTPTSKTNAFMQQLQNKLRKSKLWNSSTNTIDERYNPLAVDEDLFIPHRGNMQDTKVEVLPGAQNLGDIDDVKYFLDKILAGLKIPRDYVIENKDKGAERKANLSQLDAKFARTIIRVQENFLHGLEQVVRTHLAIRKMPKHLIAEVRIKLPDPSDIFTKRKLEIEEAKARVVSALKGLQLIPDDIIYKEYYELDELEIEDYKAKLKTQMEEMAAMMPQDPMMGGDPMGGGGEPGMEGAEGQAPNVGGRSGAIAQKQPGSANAAPTNEASIYIAKSILEESDAEKVKLLKKIQGKLESKRKAT